MSRVRGRPNEINSPFYVQLRAWEREYINNALLFFEGDIEAVCTSLGIHRRTLYNRIHALGGILDVPLNEPYDNSRMRKKRRKERLANEKSTNDRSTSKEHRDVSSDTAPTPDRKADDSDVPKDGTSNRNLVSGSSESGESNGTGNPGAVLCDEYW